MKKRKEEILHNKEQSTEQSAVQSTEQSSLRLLHSLQYSKIMSMVLVCLLYLSLVLVYFWHITHFSHITHVICFRSNKINERP